MAGNFIVFRSFVYIPGALIRSSENNTNENTIYGGHNGAFNEITGHEHTGAPGDAPRLGPASINTAANYTWTGIHNFNNTTNLNFGGTINNYTITASTLITPTIADFTLAQHNHQNPAGGGTLDAAAIAAGILPVVRGGTGVAVSTGTVAVVLSNTPTLITPVIADFTNAQHDHQSAAGGGTLNAAAIAAGILPVVRGGTGVATSTGTTNVVLSNSPTIVTPTIADFTNAQHNHQNAAGGGVLDINLATTGILGIGRGGTGAAVAPGVNQIIYSDGAAFVGNANFVWVNGTQRFGIGTGAPARTIHASIASASSTLFQRLEQTGGPGQVGHEYLDGSGLTSSITYDGTARTKTELGGALSRIDYYNAPVHTSRVYHTGSANGTIYEYSGYLNTTDNVGGSIMNFICAPGTWLSCILKMTTAINDGASKFQSHIFYFTIYNNAGTKGLGGTAGTAAVSNANMSMNWGNQTGGLYGNEMDHANAVGGTGLNQIGAGFVGPSAHNAVFGGVVGIGYCEAGNLPQYLAQAYLNFSNSLYLTDAGGDLVNLAYVPGAAAPGNQLRITAYLECIQNEYI